METLVGINKPKKSKSQSKADDSHNDKKLSKAQKAAKKSIKEVFGVMKSLEEKIKEGEKTAVNYVDKVSKRSAAMLEKQQTTQAKQVLDRALDFLQSQQDTDYAAFFKLHSAFAFYENCLENLQGSLDHLNRAIGFANQFAKKNSNPLELMPAEALLNAANACVFLVRHKDALNYADLATSSSQLAITALQNQMSMYQVGSYEMRDLDRMKSAQTSICIESHLAKANAFERIGKFKLAFEALDQAERIVTESFGSEHPQMLEVAQLREVIKEQQGYARGAHWKEGDQNFEGLDMRSDLMKKGRIKRTYFKETGKIENQDMRQQLAEFQSKEELLDCQRHGADAVNKIMQARMLQDEQFRMMEFMIETQVEHQHHHHVPIYHYKQESSPASSEDSRMSDSSSSSSSSSSEEKNDLPSVDSGSTCSFEEEYEDIIWSNEHQLKPIEFDPRPTQFELSDEVRTRKLRQAGLQFFFFDECEFKINPPSSFDLKRWLESRVLRWRFLRWRRWKQNLRELANFKTNMKPHIAAWFFKKFGKESLAEIKVYVIKYKLTRTTRIKKTKEIFKKESGKIVDAQHFEEKEENVESDTLWGYQIQARDVTSRKGTNWDPLYLAYTDMRNEFKWSCQQVKSNYLEHTSNQQKKEDRDQKLKDALNTTLVDWNEVKNQFIKSQKVLVMVKDHLVIDYIRDAIKLVSAQNGQLTGVIFNKLSTQDSMRINFRYFTAKFWFKFKRNKQVALENERRAKNIDSLSFTDRSDDERGDHKLTKYVDRPYIPTEKAIMNQTLYQEVKKFRESGIFRAPGIANMRLAIQHQARQIMEKKSVTETKLKYIVDKSKRGDDVVKPIVFAAKLDALSEVLDKTKWVKELARKRIQRAVVRFCTRIKERKNNWHFLHAINIKQPIDDLLVTIYFRLNRQISDGNNCEFRVAKKSNPKELIFLKRQPELPEPYRWIDRATADNVRFFKNKKGEIIDMAIVLDEEKRGPFCDFQVPSDGFIGTLEVCRMMVTPFFGARFCLFRTDDQKETCFFESFMKKSFNELEVQPKRIEFEEPPVALRYMLFFLNDFVDIDLRKDNTLGDINLKHWSEGLICERFLAKMRVEEAKIWEPKEEQTNILMEWTANDPAYIRNDLYKEREREKTFKEVLEECPLEDEIVEEVVYESPREESPSCCRRICCCCMCSACCKPQKNQPRVKTVQKTRKKMKEFKTVQKPDKDIVIQYMRLFGANDSEKLEKVGPYTIKVLRDKRDSYNAFTIVLTQTVRDRPSNVHKSFNQKDINSMDELRSFIDKRVGFKFDVEARLVREIVELEPEKQPQKSEQKPLSELIAKAQAIWRGQKLRKVINEDRVNLFLRFYKKCEMSVAKVSVRKFFLKLTKTYTTNLKHREGQKIVKNNAKIEESSKVTEEKKTDQQRERLIAYKVEVEQNMRDKNGNLIFLDSMLIEEKKEKKFAMAMFNRRIDEVDMPAKEIALDWFRQAIYIHWKPLGTTHEKAVSKDILAHFVERSGTIRHEKVVSEKVVKQFNQFQVEGFTIHRPEKFFEEAIWTNRKTLLQALVMKVTEPKRIPKWKEKWVVPISKKEDQLINQKEGQPIKQKEGPFCRLSQAEPLTKKDHIIKLELFKRGKGPLEDRFDPSEYMLEVTDIEHTLTLTLEQCAEKVPNRDNLTVKQLFDKVCFGNNVSAWHDIMTKFNAQMSFGQTSFRNTNVLSESKVKVQTEIVMLQHNDQKATFVFVLIRKDGKTYVTLTDRTGVDAEVLLQNQTLDTERFTDVSIAADAIKKWLQGCESRLSDLRGRRNEWQQLKSEFETEFCRPQTKDTVVRTGGPGSQPPRNLVDTKPSAGKQQQVKDVKKDDGR